MGPGSLQITDGFKVLLDAGMHSRLILNRTDAIEDHQCGTVGLQGVADSASDIKEQPSHPPGTAKECQSLLTGRIAKQCFDADAGFFKLIGVVAGDRVVQGRPRQER